ncbi:MAG: 6-phosphofructokinase [Nitrospiria bacterium]
MRHIGVLTSGGDAPGMNAAIRAVTRTAIHAGLKVTGIRYGYAGLISNNMMPLDVRDVGGIISRGGTFLRSARCPEFKTQAGQQQALQNLKQRGIDAVVIIGGNGSQTGAFHLSELGVPVVGVASTIDNDLAGTEVTIGVDTALNIALEAIDRLKTTASSHSRAFLVEVMGRDCGYLAMMSGIAGGAEVVAIPESPCDPESIAQVFRASYKRGKAHAIGVIAEGAKSRATDIAAYFKTHHGRIGFELRVTTLGHVQRGGTPGAFDRILAARFGHEAVNALLRGEKNVLVGIQKGKITTTPLSEIAHTEKPLDLQILEMGRILSI